MYWLNFIAETTNNNNHILQLQIAWDDAKKLANQRLEREKGRNDAADDLSELSEGEKEKGESNVSESVKNISRINSDIHIWSDEEKSRRLYIVLIRYFGLLAKLIVILEKRGCPCD